MSLYAGFALLPARPLKKYIYLRELLSPEMHYGIALDKTKTLVNKAGVDVVVTHLESDFAIFALGGNVNTLLY